MRKLIHPRLINSRIILTDGSFFETLNVSNMSKYIFLDQDSKSNLF